MEIELRVRPWAGMNIAVPRRVSSLIAPPRVKGQGVVSEGRQELFRDSGMEIVCVPTNPNLFPLT